MLFRNRWWKKKSHHQKNFNCLHLTIHHRLNLNQNWRLTLLWQSKYLDEMSRWKTKKSFFFRKNKSLNKENNFFFRKNNFLYSYSSKLSNELFEIENVSLNVLTSKNINSRINVINIVKKNEFENFRKILRTRLESAKKWKKSSYFTQHWWSSSIRKRQNSK
jgi:hypothetical protein